MQCKNCNLVSICNIYEFKKKHLSDVELSVDFCKHKVRQPDTSLTHINSISNINKSELSTTDFVPVEPVRDIFGARHEDAKEAERRLLKIEPIKEDKTLMTCATCGGKDYADYISICSKCGTETCGNCATSENGLNYCTMCWEEI
jgi:hypothetical protein